MKKKNIIFRLYGDKSWIGGVYYKKNILFSVIQSEKILEKYNIIVCTTDYSRHLFDDLGDKVTVKILPSNKYLFELAVIFKMLNPNSRFIYSLNSANYDKIIAGQCIQWIPDFQYKYYPQYFRDFEIEHRDVNYRKIADKKGKLVLSSQTCKDDFEKFFPNYNTETYVIPFVSYIETEVRAINDEFEKEVLAKTGLADKKYVYIPNQFWQHKNHLVVFEALKLIAAQYPDLGIKFVFTGEANDFRSPEYNEKIKSLMELPELKDMIVNLGFVPRKDQLVVMKNAKFLIQPSLFEGWGTVLEDAKVLDKSVLLSDIPIHREQKNDKCTLFDPNNPQDLVDKIIEVKDIDVPSDIEAGLRGMRENAKKYSKELERLFDC